MKKLLYIFTMVAAVFMIYSCKGPDGEVGPRGVTGDAGITGEEGLPGADGEDGEEGKGLFETEDAYNYGYIAVALEGTRPATIPFEDSVVFNMIIPTYLTGMSMMTYDADKDSSRFDLFRINRGFSFYMEEGAALEFDYVGDQVKIESAGLAYTYITDELEELFIYVDDMEDSILPENISNYSYNTSTGVLTLQFEVVVPANDNSTYRDLTVRFYVNAVVPEVMNINNK